LKIGGSNRNLKVTEPSLKKRSISLSCKTPKLTGQTSKEKQLIVEVTQLKCREDI